MKWTLRILSLIAAMYASPLMGQVQIPSLMNYQGQLAKSDGTPLPTGDYELTFSIYDTAQGGTLIWGPQKFDGDVGRGHGPKIPVVQGYFNVMLGAVDISNRTLSTAFSAASRFVEIKIGDDPPISPRQQLLSAPFAFAAGNATRLAGHDWSAILTGNSNDPTTAKIRGGAIEFGEGLTAAQIKDGEIKAEEIATGAVGADEIATGAVGTDEIATGAVRNSELGAQSVSIDKLDGRRDINPANNHSAAGAGGVALSPSSGNFISTSTTAKVIEDPARLGNKFQLNLNTTGRPVRIVLVPAGPGGSFIDFLRSSSGGQGVLRLNRDGGGPTVPSVSYQNRLIPIPSNSLGLATLPGAVSFIDFPPASTAGTYTYQLFAWSTEANCRIRIFNCRMVAYEL